MSTNTDPERDWPEDFSHENGCYLNVCVSCEKQFTGHKRRPVCKICATAAKARWDALTPEQQTEETRKNAESLAAFFAART